jgi:phage terminase large subunit
MIFEGMQDHTADSLKSLEGFGRAWVEEAQSISARSLELLLPTIRDPDSELWFSWNPDQPDDPTDAFFASKPEDAVRVHSTYLENPFCPDVMVSEAERLQRVDPDAYAHVWLGEYNVKSEARVLAGKYRIDEFEPGKSWDGPYHGCDHGFAQDPRTLVRCWIHNRCLYVERESYHVGLSIDKVATQWEADVPGFSRYVVRAESAEPGTNDYLKRHGVPKITGVKKWQGSVEDGIAHLRQYDEIVIHTRCTNTATEARLYSYKVDKRTGDILPKIEDKHNHAIDAIRYALAPLIVQQGKRFAIG